MLFMPGTAEVFQAGEMLKLDLSLNNVTGKAADLYLRLNLPSNDNQGTRLNLFKIWNSHDSLEKMPYNNSLSSPYLLTSDLILPLYGSNEALLGNEKIDYSLLEGAYELLALLAFTNSSVHTRKID